MQMLNDQKTIASLTKNNHSACRSIAIAPPMSCHNQLSKTKQKDIAENSRAK